MRSAAVLVLAVMTAACGDADRPVIIEPPLPIVLTAVVNVQLGDTPVGEQPGYIITGQAKATRGGLNVTAGIDSVVVFWRRNAQVEWTRQVQRSSVPFSDRLPFVAQPGDMYDLRAALYARASHQSVVVTATDEWVASGRAYAVGAQQIRAE